MRFSNTHSGFSWNDAVLANQHLSFKLSNLRGLDSLESKDGRMDTGENSNVIRRKILFALIKIEFEAVEFAFVTGRECACDSPVDAGSVSSQSGKRACRWFITWTISKRRSLGDDLLVMISWRRWETMLQKAGGLVTHWRSHRNGQCTLRGFAKQISWPHA